MADVKFSELNALSAADVASDDVFAIVDTSATTSKKLTIDSLFGSIPVNAKITDTTDSSSNTTGALIVSGGVGIAKSVTIGADLTVHGDTTISGNLTFGDAATDAVTFTADIASDLIPVANVTHDIGTDEFFWSNVYSNNITTTAYTQNSISILMNTTNKMYFHDTGLSIQSATDGTLDIAADTILEITAPTMNVISTTVDFDANVTIHSTFSANSTAALMGTTLPLYFRDTGLSLSSPTNGTLDIAADTILEITAPTTNVIATTAVTIHTPAITANGTFTIGEDGTGYDVTLYGDTASSVLLWDQSDDQLEFGNAAMTISDARTSVTQSLTGLTIDMYNKLDTGSSNDRIGASISTYGDTNAYTIRDSVGIRAMSRQSTGAEVTRLNTPLHSILDLANTAIANNSGTTLSGAYGLVIDHDDTIATRTGQPTAFISFGEMYVGGTESIETKYLFDIFPNGKTGDATYATAADVAFYNDGAQYATTRDTMVLNSTDGAPLTDAGDHLLMEPDPFDAILLESGTTSGEGGDDMGFITTESGESIVLEESQVNPIGFSFILFETGAQDADGVLKIRVNGEDKYIQLYNVVS